MHKPISIKPLNDFRLWVQYPDGVEGVVDLSEFAGRGVFSLWNDYRNFQQVSVGRDGAIAWNEDVEICPDAIYLKVAGKAVEEVFPALREPRNNAGNQPVLRNSH
jgi:hypothetical protein